MTFLTPLAALVALAALLPLGAWLVGRRRADAVRRTLGLPAPRARRAARTLAAAAGIVVLGLAAAQPALTHDTAVRERTDAQALFVFDTSRSMAAARTPRAPTRLDRAVAAAVRLRAAIPDVPAGVATLTDRVLPDLLPVGGRTSFDLVAKRAVAIESPPPAETSVRATSFSALSDLASGNYFAPKATRRLVVLLTDGESNPVEASDLAHKLRGDRFVALRLWRGGEHVYRSDGRAETAYRADPLGRVELGRLASSLGGRAYEESDLQGAASALRRAAGRGPTETAGDTTRSRTLLAPWLAGAALVLLLAALATKPHS
jgi:Mg-chelatase subunit ChlD